MVKTRMKEVLKLCISTITRREQKEYANLKEIYEEVAKYLEEENNESLQSQIRGRLQECCKQYAAFSGDSLFITEKVKSGNWKVESKKAKYIRYKHGKSLISNDNWDHVEKVDKVLENYELETDEDNVYRGKLTYELGKEKAEIILKELNDIRVLLKTMKHIDRVRDGYGLAFEVFAISTIYNIEYEESICKYIIHGDLDGKIDAIYYGDMDQVFIYQIKLGNISDTAYEEMKKNYISCLHNNESPEHGKNLYDFVKKNKEILKVKEEKYVTISENSLKTTNKNPQEIYELYFANKILPISNNHLTLRIQKPGYLNGNYNISTDGNNNFNFYIKASILINNLLEALGIGIDFHDHEKIDLSKYFTDNVRGVLSPNKNMLQTIEIEPENFVKYNNGISITGKVKDLGSQIEIVNPVINNGQQTITTLVKTYKDISKVVLPVKVTDETDIEIKGKISQYTNEQVRVKPIDILSLNVFVRKIQKEIYEEGNYFLKIYSSGKKGYDDILSHLYKKNNIISLLDFIKLYFSLENKKDLGLWKNSPSYQLEQIQIDHYFDKLKSLKVCNAIAQFKDYLDTVQNKKVKDDLKSADLAFKYILCTTSFEPTKIEDILMQINQKYYYQVKDEKSKLIDIYKSTTIINKIEEFIQKDEEKGKK